MSFKDTILTLARVEIAEGENKTGDGFTYYDSLFIEINQEGKFQLVVKSFGSRDSDKRSGFHCKRSLNTTGPNAVINTTVTKSYSKHAAIGSKFSEVIRNLACSFLV